MHVMYYINYLIQWHSVAVYVTGCSPVTVSITCGANVLIMRVLGQGYVKVGQIDVTGFNFFCCPAIICYAIIIRHSRYWVTSVSLCYWLHCGPWHLWLICTLRWSGQYSILHLIRRAIFWVYAKLVRSMSQLAAVTLLRFIRKIFNTKLSHTNLMNDRFLSWWLNYNRSRSLKPIVTRVDPCKNGKNGERRAIFKGETDLEV